MALFGWGVQPGDTRNLSDIFYDRVSGSSTSHRMDIIHVKHSEKPKKARRSIITFLGGSKVQRAAQDPTIRQVLGDAQQRDIQEDNWRRDQGGAAVGRRGWGVTIPEVDPGPGPGFVETPQIFGPPGGYYDPQGMWHDY
jgi:hypothetical protein